MEFTSQVVEIGSQVVEMESEVVENGPEVVEKHPEVVEKFPYLQCFQSGSFFRGVKIPAILVANSSANSGILNSSYSQQLFRADAG